MNIILITYWPIIKHINKEIHFNEFKIFNGQLCFLNLNCWSTMNSNSRAAKTG